jgi:hypothetical protein
MAFTKEQLEFLGIYSIESKIYPNRYFVPCLGEVDLYDSTSVEDIFKMIWKAGYEFGEEVGKNKKISELKKVLKIEEE